MTRESVIEKKVKDWAGQHGILPLKMTPHGVVGYPDDFFLGGMGEKWGWPTHPKTAIIEFKKEGADPKPIQRVRIGELQSRGYPVKVVRSVEDGIEFLREVFRIVD